MPIIISDHSSMTSLILLVLLIVTFAPPLSTTALTTTISVCQNKDCCQRFTSKSANLVQTLDHLLCTVDADSDVAVESSGCLGQCGQGPNIQVVQHQLTQSTILGHLETADAAAIALKGLNMTVHPTLLAASNVMERALRAATSQEQELCLTSVITALSKHSDFSSSHAMAYALVLRSTLLLSRRDNAAAAAVAAKEDACRATFLHPRHTTAWRILADAEETLGNSKGAMEALQQWAVYQPMMKTKVNKEIERLKNQISTKKSNV